MRTYKTSLFIIGATAFAAGVCRNFRGSMIVADSGDVASAEFTAAYRSDGKEDSPLLTDAGNELKNELKSRGILSEMPGTLPQLAAAGPVICRYFNESSAVFFFRSVVISVKYGQDGFHIGLFTTGGICEITAEHILDTTSAGVVPRFFGYKPTILQASLNSIVYCKGDIPCGSFGRFSLFKGNVAHQGYMRFELALPVTCAEAHEEQYNAWKNRSGQLSDLRIAYTSPILDILPDEFTGELPAAAEWIPSVRYGNLVRAFDCGADFALKSEVQL